MLEKLTRRAVFVLVPVTLLLLSVAPRRDEEEQEAREEAFAALLSGATLTGCSSGRSFSPFKLVPFSVT